MEAALVAVQATKIDSTIPHTLEYHLHHLRKNLWNTQLPPHSVDLDSQTTGFNFTQGKLLLFDGYPALLQRLQAARADQSLDRRRGLLLTGNPGIGECLLIR